MMSTKTPLPKHISPWCGTPTKNSGVVVTAFTSAVKALLFKNDKKARSTERDCSTPNEKAWVIASPGVSTYFKAWDSYRRTQIKSHCILVDTSESFSKHGTALTDLTDLFWSACQTKPRIDHRSINVFEHTIGRKRSNKPNKSILSELDETYAQMRVLLAHKGNFEEDVFETKINDLRKRAEKLEELEANKLVEELEASYPVRYEPLEVALAKADDLLAKYGEDTST